MTPRLDVREADQDGSITEGEPHIEPRRDPGSFMADRRPRERMSLQ